MTVVLYKLYVQNQLDTDTLGYKYYSQIAACNSNMISVINGLASLFTKTDRNAVLAFLMASIKSLWLKVSISCLVLWLITHSTVLLHYSLASFKEFMVYSYYSVLIHNLPLNLPC